MVNISKLQDSYLRIKNYIVNTPILISEELNRRFNASFFLKNEVDQVTGSFKIRGALSALSNLKDKNVEGVVAFSSGNHAQGVSKAAQIFDIAGSTKLLGNISTTFDSFVISVDRLKADPLTPTIPFADKNKLICFSNEIFSGFMNSNPDSLIRLK